MRLIDADALQAQIQQDYDLFVDSTYLPDKARRDELSNVLARIINAPTIEAAPVRHGKWKHIPEEPFEGYYVCSVCNEQAEVSSFEQWLLTDYCPFCGAKMEVE